MLILLRLPLLIFVTVVVFLWSFNLYRHRATGVWSNFQPLLTALILLIAVACLPSAWQFFAGPSPEHYLGALGLFYLMAVLLQLLIPLGLDRAVRGPRRPPSRRRTSPGFPFDDGEHDR